MANLRKIDCEHYSACLDRAAKNRGKFNCEACERYSRMEAVEEGFEHELYANGIGGTDNTVQLSVSARKDQEIRMNTQAEQKPTSRKCTRCGEEKTLNDFAKSAMGKYGRRSICKPCDSAASNKYNLKKRMLKNAKAAVQTIAPGSTVLKKVMDKAKAAKAARIDDGVDKLAEGTELSRRGLSVELAVDSNARAQALADEHWAYVRSLLAAHGDYSDPEHELSRIEFHYKSAMIHGYKHGVDDRERAIQS
jgi:hypothetical protein